MAQTVEEILQEAFDMYSGREVNEAAEKEFITKFKAKHTHCLLYTSPSPRD